MQVVYTGPDALAHAREIRPDVVLLDIGLPGMDGYTVARLIKGDAELKAIRLVALTGFGQTEERQRAQKAGFDLYLTKPVDPAQLRKALETLQARCIDAGGGAVRDRRRAPLSGWAGAS